MVPEINTKPNLFDSITNTIIMQLQAAEKTGRSPWVRPWKTGVMPELPTNGLSRRPYHGINTLLLWIAAMARGYSSHYWVTFKQKNTIASELGIDIQIRKGEKASTVVRWVSWIPKRYRRTAEGMYFDTSTNRTVTKREAEAVVPKVYKVFNFDQLEGLPTDYYLPAAEPDFDLVHARAWEFINRMPATQNHVSESAHYHPTFDTINIPPAALFDSEDELLATTFHELVHWTGHESRLDRFKKGGFGPGQEYAFEELVAELGATFLCAQFQVPIEKLQHVEYIGGWLELLQSDTKNVMRAAAKAQKAVDHLLIIDSEVSVVLADIEEEVAA